jgi:hypothetical protein
VRSSPVLALLVLCGAAFGGSALAAGTEAAERCKSIGDDHARLACYDETYGMPSGAGAQPLPAAAAAGTSVPASYQQTAAPANPEADFGLSEAARRAREAETGKQGPPDSMSASVTTVGWRPSGEMIITLANGQVWVQLEPDTRARVKSGDTVTIKRAALGSYMLLTPSDLATRVKRLK